MAHGDGFSSETKVGITTKTYGSKLLDAAGAVTDGAWIDTRILQPGSVDVTGTFTGTVKICGSNAESKPDNTNHGNQMGMDITTPGLVQLSIRTRWVKARVSAWTSGTINANYHSVN